MIKRLFILLPLAALPFISACSDSGEASGAGNSGMSSTGGDARLGDAQIALMRGDVGVARGLAKKLSQGDLDVQLLMARIAFVEGNEVEALRIIEEAKRAQPNDGRPFATSVELHAARGRSFSAEEALRAGWAVAGQSPELERARGVLLLSQPGGGLEGLTALNGALESNPNLSYLALPLAQAHQLVARRFLGAAQPDMAEEHALEALRFDPTGIDARELTAEVYAAQSRFDEALLLYDELSIEGVELTAMRIDLRVKAATAALLRSERIEALEHYVVARSLGASDEELGFGAHVIVEAAADFVGSGVALLKGGRAVEARADFETALDLSPDHLAALSYLGHACFKADDSAAAVNAWQRVLTLAGNDLVLPEPIVVNLAKALRKDGRRNEGIECLELYLKQRPNDRWRLEAGDLLSMFLSERSRGAASDR